MNRVLLRSQRTSTHVCEQRGNERVPSWNGEQHGRNRAVWTNFLRFAKGMDCDSPPRRRVSFFLPFYDPFRFVTAVRTFPRAPPLNSHQPGRATLSLSPASEKPSFHLSCLDYSRNATRSAFSSFFPLFYFPWRFLPCFYRVAQFFPPSRLISCR